MYRFWTADQHYNNANICKYCQRPVFKLGDLNEKDEYVDASAALRCAEKNNAMLIRNANQRVKPEDVVICVGDFSCKGKERGVESLKVKPSEILETLNGKYVIVSGNHDDNNGVKSNCDFLSTTLENFKVGAQHKPLFDFEAYDRFMNLPKPEQDKMPWVKILPNPEFRKLKYHAEYCRNMFDFMIVGHVHQSWHVKKIAGIWHVNVGVDVNRYMPITDVEVCNLYRKAVRV